MPRSRALTDATVDYVERLSRNRRTVRNVVGILRGADPARAGEAVVLGAHYDHVGLGGRFSGTPERTGEIHNGADDNASGIAAIIEMARAAAADRARFPRSLVFVAFAGEERGLLGSAHYADAAGRSARRHRRDAQPRHGRPLARQGGRQRAEASPSLEADVQAREQRRAAGLRSNAAGPGPGAATTPRSSTAASRRINFFTGFHDDYHRPGDDWDKIDAAGTARVATLALELAARSPRPTADVDSTAAEFDHGDVDRPASQWWS